MAKERLIYSNHWDEDDFKEWAKEEIDAEIFTQEEFDADEDSFRERYFDYLAELYDDEVDNIKYSNKDFCGYIVSLWSVGTWQGRLDGFHYNGNEPEDVFDIPSGGIDYFKFYADRYNVYTEQQHHDGTNIGLIRYVTSEAKVDYLSALMSQGKLNREKFMRLTKSVLPLFDNTYGKGWS